MTETIKVSIGGLAFTFNKDAYLKLDSYLDSLQKYFANKADGDEIITDIEIRISELLEIQQTAKQDKIIDIEAVNYIIEIIGTPSEFSIDDETAQNNEVEAPKVKKKLYRDIDNKVFGGVCSGLGQYFNIEPILIRVILVIAVLFGNAIVNKTASFTILIYIILWIIVPSAKSVQQKIAMMNKNSSIDEFESKKVKRKELRGANAGKIVVSCLKIISSILLLVYGLSLLMIPILLTFFGYVSNIPSMGSIAETFGFSSLNTNTSILLGGVIPALILIYLGVRILTGFRKRDVKYIAIACLVWILSIVYIAKLGVDTYNNFKVEAEHTETIAFDQKYDSVYIDIDKLNANAEPFFANTNIYIGSKKPLSWFILPDIEIVKDQNIKDIKVTIEKKAWAKDDQEANSIVDNGINLVTIKDSIIMLKPEIFSKTNIFDKQTFKLKIYCPENKKIIIKDPINEWMEMDKNPQKKGHLKYTFDYYFEKH